ncbi:MAG: flippase [Sphingomonadaceae bacterium]
MPVLLRNTLYNLAGSIAPIALALATIPLYISQIGPERYGALAIVWLVLGYFGIFDMGLGRATARRIARLAASPARPRATKGSDIFWTAMLANCALGLIGAAALYIGAGYYFVHHIELNDSMRQQLMASLPLLALAVPVATATGVCSGALQGREEFLAVNVTTTISSALFQILPLICACILGPDLGGLILAAVIARLIGLGLFFMHVWQKLLRGTVPHPDPAEARALFSFSGWVTVTAMLAPILVSTDRLMIGAMISAAAVTVYNVPFEIVQRASLLPRAIGTAIFPRLAASDETGSRELARRANLILLTVTTLPVIGMLFLIRPFLALWAGETLAGQAAPIAWALLAGYWYNGLAVVPYARLTAAGRPGLVTMTLALQIPFFIGAMYLAITHYGLVAAAWVFAARCLADLLIMNRLSSGRPGFPPLAGFLAFVVTGLALAMPWLDGVRGLWATLLTGIVIGTVVGTVQIRRMPDEMRPVLQRFLPDPVFRTLRFI